MEASLQKGLVDKAIFMTFITAFIHDIMAKPEKLIIAHICNVHFSSVYIVLLSFKFQHVGLRPR